MEETTSLELDTSGADSPDSATCDVDQASQPFVGQWQQLISTTNWEKGRIIAEWRDSLISADAPVIEYSDDAWSRRVGGVTGQHVGRLRRVFQRFGESHANFRGLFWSHFQAALDWDDAEMWLEGAVQSKWSISDMRTTRWQTLGATEALRPQEAEIVATELDEDVTAESLEEDPQHLVAGHVADMQTGPRHEDPDFGDEESGDDAEGLSSNDDGDSSTMDATLSRPELVRPFENLPELPPDMSDAFDSFKLAIIRHKAEGWQQISLDGVLASLDALKQLAVAAASDAPF